MRPALSALLLAGCVVDNQLGGKDEATDPFDTGSTFTVPIDSDSDSPVQEECNGVDDDGDGEVDEDFPDADGNGRADCLDQTCPALDLGSAGTVAIPEACSGETSGGGTEVPDPWSVKVKWSFQSPSACGSCTGSYSMPAIGNLDDDNGDGDVDEDDSPEVVLSMTGGYVVALDGATGTEKWSASGYDYYSGVMIADVDADGYPDVVSGTSSKHTAVLEGDGSAKWTATDMATAIHYVIPTAADLDEDGTPEVIHDDLVIDGMDGSTKFSLDQPFTSWDYRLAAIADVDNDGDQEIAFNGKLFDSDGTELWDSGTDGRYGFWPVILQADSDDDAEIGFVGNTWSLYEPDGTQLYETTYNTTAQPGPPCVGDFDGDGQSEVAWPSYDTFVMYEIDGTKVWSVPMDDSSGLAGCSGYDLNNDGALEILFADQTTFTIFDGATGDELYSDINHSSVTIFEYPTVADIDHDDHAEILVVHQGSRDKTLTVYENDGVGWPAAGTTWATHDFAITNVDRDGSIPQHPDPYWLKYNVYRSRVAADDPSLPDLAVSITDQCVADCTYGPVAVGVQVTNNGGATVESGSVLSLYANDDTGERLVATYLLPEIAPGTRLDGIEFPLTAADVGRYGWIARVDEDGLLNECDETNNEDRWADTPCP